MARLGQQGRSPCSISIWGPGRSGRRTRSRHPCRARAAAVRWSARTKVGNKSSGGTSGYRRDLGEVALAAAHPVHCKVTLLEWEFFAALPRHSLSALRLGVGAWAVHGALSRRYSGDGPVALVLGAERGDRRFQLESSFFLNATGRGLRACGLGLRACGLGLGPRPSRPVGASRDARVPPHETNGDWTLLIRGARPGPPGTLVSGPMAT
jgi:hypothetical protein